MNADYQSLRVVKNNDESLMFIDLVPNNGFGQTPHRNAGLEQELFILRSPSRFILEGVLGKTSYHADRADRKGHGIGTGTYSTHFFTGGAIKPIKLLKVQARNQEPIMDYHGIYALRIHAYKSSKPVDTSPTYRPTLAMPKK